MIMIRCVGNYSTIDPDKKMIPWHFVGGLLGPAATAAASEWDGVGRDSELSRK